jgi:hypothetical protein
MRTVHERCCGLDVHKKTVVACVLTSTSKETRTFGTMTHELLEFVEWLEQEMGDPRRDGEHWRLLEAGLQSA